MLPLLLHNLPVYKQFQTFASLLFAGIVFLALGGCTDYKVPTPASNAAITLSATAFNFQTVVVGQTQTQKLHLTNTGTASLNITGLTLTDKQFVIAGPSIPRTVAPNASLDYSVSFKPSTPGLVTASLKIASNAANAVAAVALTGTGEKVVAAATVSPSSISFGTLTLQTTSTKNVTLQNSGDVSITISGVTVVGSGFGYSNLSPGYALSPNQSVTFQVWFKPTIKGPSTGTLSILSASLSSPETLALSGDGASSTTNPPPTPPPTPPPPAVQHTVHLTWTPSDSTVAGYRVYRSLTPSGGFQPVSTSLVSSAFYDDDTVASGKTYYYEVTAVDTAGVESNSSNEATAVVPTP